MLTNDKEALKSLVDIVSLSKILCDVPIRSHLCYATQENFIGSIVDGYTYNVLDIPLMTNSPYALGDSIPNII
jgi:hypothetical protein